MNLILAKTIQVGEKIKTSNGWEKVIAIKENGVDTNIGFLSFGSTIYGWKAG